MRSHLALPHWFYFSSILSRIYREKGEISSLYGKEGFRATKQAKGWIWMSVKTCPECQAGLLGSDPGEGRGLTMVKGQHTAINTAFSISRSSALGNLVWDYDIVKYPPLSPNVFSYKAPDCVPPASNTRAALEHCTCGWNTAPMLWILTTPASMQSS